MFCLRVSHSLINKFHGQLNKCFGVVTLPFCRSFLGVSKSSQKVRVLIHVNLYHSASLFIYALLYSSDTNVPFSGYVESVLDF